MCVLISKHHIICCLKGLKAARMQKNTFHVLLDGRCFQLVPGCRVGTPMSSALNALWIGSCAPSGKSCLVLVQHSKCFLYCARSADVPPFPPPLNLKPQMSSFGKYLVETFLHFFGFGFAMVLHRCNDKCRLCYLLTINKKK
jgi:hypothetical protein